MTVKDMLGRSGVVSREEALRILNEHLVVPDLSSEEIFIDHALGRVTAEELTSHSDLPGFNRSTMDGFAVRSADTFGASEAHPAYLSVVGDVPMGAIAGRTLSKGETMKISTGGALPEGADAVVMLEHTQPVDDRSIEVVKPAGPLENVIQAGDDIKTGEVILSLGRKLRPQDMAALAGVGITRVRVFDKPKVAIISTGNEIIPADGVPAPGQVRDINSYNLEGLVMEAGGVAVKMGIIRDDYARLRESLETAINGCVLILITGGSSVGTADITANVINDLGPPGVLVHGVSIKPGKPLIIGVAGASGRHVPVFGVPGHPAAVSICFELFVKSVLVRLTGEKAQPGIGDVPPYRTVRARLARSIASSPGREDHVRVMLERKSDGLWARPVFGASGLISTLVKAVGTVVVPENKIGVEAGEEVEVKLF